MDTTRRLIYTWILGFLDEILLRKIGAIRRRTAHAVLLGVVAHFDEQTGTYAMHRRTRVMRIALWIVGWLCRLRIVAYERHKVSRRDWCNVRVKDEDNFAQRSAIPNGNVQVGPWPVLIQTILQTQSIVRELDAGQRQWVTSALADFDQILLPALEQIAGLERGFLIYMVTTNGA